ncbi:hypothetical protein [Herbaspirillum sp. NPDC087042]|uniref:hypothetical protein n=1 Tax=Herbaspirillum sp. NPDC087042 TaxID=3364004 RepID=UPI00380268B0
MTSRLKIQVEEESVGFLWRGDHVRAASRYNCGTEVWQKTSKYQLFSFFGRKRSMSFDPIDPMILRPPWP